MRIGYDGKRAVRNMTGLGNYSRLVIEEMAAKYKSDEFLVYTPSWTRKDSENPRLKRINELPNVEYRYPYGLGPLSQGTLWRSFGITRHFLADKLDLYHGLSNELPLNIKEAGVASVVTIHDLIYRRLPYCYPPLDRKIYDYKYSRSARLATRVIAISERTKQDLVELHHVDPERIDVIYQGCDPSFRRAWTEQALLNLRKRLNLPDRYLLQVGTIERRKNLELSVRALPQIDKNIKLVAVGRDNLYLPYIKKLAREIGVEDRIIHLQGLPFADLPGLNQGAEIILYPSRYEGFGIPVLEGLESRRPVIAATGSCLEEAGGDAAVYVEPESPRMMAEAINTLLADTAQQQQRIARGLEWARRFNPEDMTSRIMETYQKAIEQYEREKKLKIHRK